MADDWSLEQCNETFERFKTSSKAFSLVHHARQFATNIQTQTLYILDSSYNPPSEAHATIVQSALQSHPELEHCRVLLLLSISNADKAPTPASFPQRLYMIKLFATSLCLSLLSLGIESAIDIGLTTKPYYTDKTQAIIESDSYFKGIKHCHLMGYDTLIRFLNPKYYEAFNPPLSPLNHYFANGNSLIILLRPDENDNGGTNDQRKYIENLENGSMDKHGFQLDWLSQLTILDSKDAIGVSSTKARKVAQTQEWSLLSIYVCPEIASFIKEQNLYQ